MATLRTKVGHGLAKGLGIKLQKSEPYQDELTRGESVLSVQTGETFIEEEPSTAEFLREIIPNGQQVRDYLWSLFPFLHWIGFYNGQWLAGDLVAGKPLVSSLNLLIVYADKVLLSSGITVGAVVVPQGMAYAILANLPPQFGLYSSFMGVLIYWFFATSKDITIGVSSLRFPKEYVTCCTCS